MTSFPQRIALFLLACLVPISALAQERALHSFVPPSAFAVLLAKPKAMLSQPAFELVPHELIKVFGEKELGLDLLDITEVVFVVDKIGDPSMRQPPSFGAVVRFGKAQKINSSFTEQLKQLKVGDYEAFGDPRGELGFFQMDDKTFVGGILSFLPTLIEKHSSGELYSALDKMPGEDHLNFMIQLDPIRDLIDSGLPSKNEVPPPFNEFFAIPDLIKSIAYRANFSSQSVSELTIEANSEKEAQRIVRLVEKAIELGKGAVLTGIAGQLKLSPDYEEATVAYAERLTDAIKTGLKPKIEGAQLTYDLGSGSKEAALANIGTMGIVVAITLPAVQQVREGARRSTSMNNMRQIGIAMHNSASADRIFPVKDSYDKNGKPLLSWRVHLLPYLEEEKLFNEFKLDEPWDSEHNIKLLDRMPDIYQNPNSLNGSQTQYLGVSGSGTAFEGKKKLGFRDFVKGVSKTAILVEANPDQAVDWTRPVDWEVDEDAPFRGLGRVRPGIFLAAMADGSIQMISLNTAPEFWFLLTQLEE